MQTDHNSGAVDMEDHQLTVWLGGDFSFHMVVGMLVLLRSPSHSASCFSCTQRQQQFAGFYGTNGHI
jgi:hypothetical protein